MRWHIQPTTHYLIFSHHLLLLRLIFIAGSLSELFTCVRSDVFSSGAATKKNVRFPSSYPPSICLQFASFSSWLHYLIIFTLFAHSQSLRLHRIIHFQVSYTTQFLRSTLCDGTANQPPMISCLLTIYYCSD